MAIFYHIDVRDEIQPGEILATMPVKSSTYPEGALELNAMFPQGVSFFGATVMLHMAPDSPDATIEHILETIRRKFIEKCGVDYPSRMSSVFACADLESARQFQDNFQRQHGKIWEVECDDFFKGDMSYVCPEMVNNHNLGVHYWQGRQKGEQPFWEYLLRPPVKVIREITVQFDVMKILFLHGWTSTPGGTKPTYLKDHGHEVVNPKLPDEDFGEAVRTAQAEFYQHQPDIVVGSSRGGAVAMNIDSQDTPLVLLCPAWKNWGTATTVKPNTTILHSRADDVVPFADSEELVTNSVLPPEALIEIGDDHRLADPEPLKAMLEACERSGKHHSKRLDIDNAGKRAE